jgi:hypothetical protein
VQSSATPVQQLRSITAAHVSTRAATAASSCSGDSIYCTHLVAQYVALLAVVGGGIESSPVPEAEAIHIGVAPQTQLPSGMPSRPAVAQVRQRLRQIPAEPDVVQYVRNGLYAFYTLLCFSCWANALILRWAWRNALPYALILLLHERQPLPVLLVPNAPFANGSGPVFSAAGHACLEAGAPLLLPLQRLVLVEFLVVSLHGDLGAREV